MIADAGAASASTAPPLLRTGLADPYGFQRSNVGKWIVGILFHLQDSGQAEWSRFHEHAGQKGIYGTRGNMM